MINNTRCFVLFSSWYSNNSGSIKNLKQPEKKSQACIFDYDASQISGTSTKNITVNTLILYNFWHNNKRLLYPTGWNTTNYIVPT